MHALVLLAGMVQDARLLANGSWEPVEAALTDADMRAFHEFGPSHKLPAAFIQQLAALGRPVVPWTVDDEAALDKVVAAGAMRVLTNVPLRMAAVAKARAAACQQRARGGEHGGKGKR
jgi:glycerophosphoryl diester phosphodiesterase